MTKRVAAGFVLSCAIACSPQLRAQSSVPNGKVEGWILARRTTIDSGSRSAPHVYTTRMVGTANRLSMESHVPTSRGNVTSRTLYDFAARKTLVILDTARSINVQPFPNPRLLVRIEPISQTQTFKDLGPSDTIVGYATNRYVINGISTAQIVFGDRSCIIRRPVSLESWTTADPGVVAVSRRALTMIKEVVGGGSTIRITPPGAPAGVALRTRTSVRMKGADGVTRELTTTTEVAEFKRGLIDAGLLEVPSGYRESPPMPASVIPRLEEMMRAGAEKRFLRMVDSTPPVPGETRHCTTTKP